MRIGEINRLKHRKNLLFVNKMKQNNFVNRSAPAVVGTLQVTKVFPDYAPSSAHFQQSTSVRPERE